MLGNVKWFRLLVAYKHAGMLRVHIGVEEATDGPYATTKRNLVEQ